jgi:malate dehydrogenase (oxaloacetate-decarboxylating)
MDKEQASIELHRQHQGKLAVSSKISVTNKAELSLAYTPGVAGPAKAIAANPALANQLTWKGNTVAVISDGSAVLGLGNIGPEAALPVMEGKALLFKQFANIDAVPIVLATQDTQEIIDTVVRLAPSFAGINLEDISAPRCFTIETELQKRLNIPIFHDDQHGTAIVVLAGLINACKLKNLEFNQAKVVINGAGAAAIATTKLLLTAGFNHITMCDTKGVIHKDRTDLNEIKREIAQLTNPHNQVGTLSDAIVNADIFIGLSAAGALTTDMVKTMQQKPIVIALANPIPEIMPVDALAAGAFIVATGRSDFPNQINNVLGFPGIFRGLLDKQVPQVTTEIKLRAAYALAGLIVDPRPDYIVPDPFDERVVPAIASAV